jgi:signal transduction histidine kinase
MNRTTALAWAVVFAWWTLSGLASAAQALMMSDAAGTAIGAGYALRTGLASAWLWVPLTMGLLWLVRRHPLERRRLWSSLAVLALGVAAVIVLRALAVFTLNDWIGWYAQLPPLSTMMVSSFWNNLFLSWLIVGVAHAFLFAERMRQRERQAEELQRRLTQARLEALSAQLNPHFLFNALNSIAELVHRDAEAADRMLVGLGSLLRGSLDSGRRQEVPLAEEIALLECYIDIEKARLGERLQVDWRVEREALQALVPPLLLQPLVENAIRHGISGRVTPGRISVRARREQGHLVLEVQDSGAGTVSSTPGHGLGLGNTRARLECLYGTDHELSLEPRTGGGKWLRIRVPIRYAVEAA